MTVLAVAWSVTRVPVYQAQAKLFVSIRTADASVGELQQGNTYAQQVVKSYVEVVNTSIVMDQVASELGGGISPDAVSKHVTASSPANSVLIFIAATDSDPEMSAKIANTTSSVFADVIVNLLEKPAEGAAPRVQIELVQPAQAPGSPISPNISRNVALGFLLGLLLGLGIAVLRSVLDVRINSKRDVAQVTDLPILGGIIRDNKASERPLIVQDAPNGPRAEAFRQLRTNLRFLKVEGNPHSFVITSGAAAEGKSTIASNLAITLAEAGSSVCLVDGDLRKPRVADLFGIEGGVGVTDVIIGRVDLSKALQQWGREGLWLLPSGHRPPNPSELLGSAEMAQILKELESQFDYVIVDAPPVLVVTDAALISRSVGGTIVIAAAGKTKRPELASALEALSTIGARVLGIVLTMIPEKGPDSYGYAAYSYGDTHPGVPVSSFDTVLSGADRRSKSVAWSDLKVPAVPSHAASRSVAGGGVPLDAAPKKVVGTSSEDTKGQSEGL